MSAAAIIIIRRKQFIRRFAERGALSPDRAIPFAQVGMRRSWIFRQMVSRGVFVPVGADCFYLSMPAATAFLAAQRRRGLVFTAIALLVLLAVALASIRW